RGYGGDGPSPAPAVASNGPCPGGDVGPAAPVRSCRRPPTGGTARAVGRGITNGRRGRDERHRGWGPRGASPAPAPGTPGRRCAGLDGAGPLPRRCAALPGLPGRGADEGSPPAAGEPMDPSEVAAAESTPVDPSWLCRPGQVDPPVDSAEGGTMTPRSVRADGSVL